ncbi:hypothetical protein WEI85_44100 [Actinomycetes bacterium KLBMP 9797]
MPAVVRMPSEQQLPPGPRRRFVEELFIWFRAANRPTYRAITDQMMRREDGHGTASHETVRRTLQGLTVPASWATIEAIVVALCDLADVDPHSRRWASQESFNEEDDRTSIIDHVRKLWNKAIDDEPDPPMGSDPSGNDELSL